MAPLPASRRLRPPELQGVGGELLGRWRRAGSPRPGERPPSLPEAPSERLGELARILDRLRQGRGEPALRLRLADLLASPGVGDAWLEAKRDDVLLTAQDFASDLVEEMLKVRRRRTRAAS